MDSYVRAGLRFDVVEQGPSDGPVVLLLHGFPQTSDSWAAVAGRLAAAGYRTIAPDQRGYSPGARPQGRSAYKVPELVADAAALIREVSDGPVHVVGHDWGGIVAWVLAGDHPELVASVTGVSVPHPGGFLRSMGHSRQALLSWYMLAFQVPALPERALSRPGALAAVLRRSGQSDVAARRDEAALAARGPLREALTGGLNWYRALPLSAGPSTVDTRAAPVVAPAMLVWSDGDSFLSRASVEANAPFMAGPYRFEVLPGVSHWIPDAVPDRLADLVLEHIDGTPGADPVGDQPTTDLRVRRRVVTTVSRHAAIRQRRDQRKVILVRGGRASSAADRRRRRALCWVMTALPVTAPRPATATAPPLPGGQQRRGRPARHQWRRCPPLYAHARRFDQTPPCGSPV